ncbi:MULTISPECIES: lysophospholipid acyltransferase family protein [Rhodococcus]|uniref:lysophospholipid acyltransferase family protein n=1 Tax=Rhodococcus TaxID=1827 RepID=UPI000D07F9A4|nr:MULTISPECIES: lysophospholipid acyltransferase family protein [Rhodococcus]AYA27470.1 1-acyl-sn-glycerol-3-phosphate acyltransferase [Rhodococcus rhodochrous]BDB63397.1 putative 1-acylglycerol-3-phosphate O-acyltransferase [Rhodococcus sp. RDE2]
MRLWSACFYRLCRYALIGPALYLRGRPKIVGRGNIPRRGPVIVAANHLAVLDSFYLTLAARRQITFLAKREYFDRGGVTGRLQRGFFSAMGQIPVDRRGGATASPALEAATRIVEQGGAWGIHPEGTRSPDGRLYRGRTGAVRVAMDTDVPLVPVAITGTRPDPSVPWWRRRVVVEVLEPLDLDPFRDAGATGVRAATDELMRMIGARTGQQYVDAYARQWNPPADQPDAA